MAATITIQSDTLSLLNILKNQGVDDSHAEAIVEALKITHQTTEQAINEGLENRLTLFKSELKPDFEVLDQKIDRLDKRMVKQEGNMNSMELRLKLHVGAMLIALGGFLKYFG